LTLGEHNLLSEGIRREKKLGNLFPVKISLVRGGDTLAAMGRNSWNRTYPCHEPTLSPAGKDGRSEKGGGNSRTEKSWPGLNLTSREQFFSWGEREALRILGKSPETRKPPKKGGEVNPEKWPFSEKAPPRNGK